MKDIGGHCTTILHLCASYATAFYCTMYIPGSTYVDIVALGFFILAIGFDIVGIGFVIVAINFDIVAIGFVIVDVGFDFVALCFDIAADFVVLFLYFEVFGCVIE